MWSQPGDVCSQRGAGAIGNFVKTFNQLLRSDYIMQPLGGAHVGVVETMKIMAAIKNNEGIVDVFRPFERFPDGAGVTELPCKFGQPGVFNRQLPAFMHNDQQFVGAGAEQELA